MTCVGYENSLRLFGGGDDAREFRAPRGVDASNVERDPRRAMHATTGRFLLLPGFFGPVEPQFERRHGGDDARVGRHRAGPRQSGVRAGRGVRVGAIREVFVRPRRRRFARGHRATRGFRRRLDHSGKV